MKKQNLAVIGLVGVLALLGVALVWEPWKPSESLSTSSDTSTTAGGPSRPARLEVANHSGGTCKIVVGCTGQGHQMHWTFELDDGQSSSPVETGGPFTVRFIEVERDEGHIHKELDRLIEMGSECELRIGPGDEIQIVEVGN